MNRFEIYDELDALIPEIRRRECTPRVMAPVDLLLDQLIELGIIIPERIPGAIGSVALKTEMDRSLAE